MKVFVVIALFMVIGFIERTECETTPISAETTKSSEDTTDKPCQTFIFNATTQVCEESTNCEGSETENACLQENIDVCPLPKFSGPCKGFFPRFYFDTNAQICKPFVYGGCNSNGNNFDSIEACQKKCEPVDPCTLNMDHGIRDCSNEPSARLYYNSTSKRCQRFVYYGCGGNENNFETIYDCRFKCVQMSVFETLLWRMRQYFDPYFKGQK